MIGPRNSRGVRRVRIADAIVNLDDRWVRWQVERKPASHRMIRAQYDWRAELMRTLSNWLPIPSSRRPLTRGRIGVAERNKGESACRYMHAAIKSPDRYSKAPRPRFGVSIPLPVDSLNGYGGGNHERYEHRLRPIALNAIMKGMPGKKNHDWQYHSVDEHTCRTACRPPLSISRQPHAPENENWRRRDADLPETYSPK